jgi:hypothetical protein
MESSAAVLLLLCSVGTMGRRVPVVITFTRAVQGGRNRREKEESKFQQNKESTCSVSYGIHA